MFKQIALHKVEEEDRIPSWITPHKRTSVSRTEPFGKNAGKTGKSNSNNPWECVSFDDILAGYFSNLTPSVDNNRVLGKSAALRSVCSDVILDIYGLQNSS